MKKLDALRIAYEKTRAANTFTPADKNDLPYNKTAFPTLDLWRAGAQYSSNPLQIRSVTIYSIRRKLYHLLVVTIMIELDRKVDARFWKVALMIIC